MKSKFIIEKVESFFNIGEQIVVAVSGGADSMVLLHSLKSSKKNFNLIVAHLNHNLRGQESKRDEEFVKKFCRENDILFICKSLDIAKIAKEEKISLEECGRNKRYEFFNEIGGIIATAHTLSDVVETFFLNILRGTALKGLVSIPQKRGKIVRPILQFTRDEIENYCKENKICYVNDSTNFEEKFLRNKIRLNVIPAIKKIDGFFEKNLLKTLNYIKLDENFLSEFALKKFHETKFNEGIILKKFNILEEAIKLRVLEKFFKLKKIPISSNLLLRVLAICSKGFGKQSIPQRKFAVIKRGILYIEEEKKLKEFEILINDQFNSFTYKNLYFIKCDVKNYKYFLNKINYLFLFKIDYDKIVGNVCLRNKRAKDKIKLLNRPTKTVKAIMRENRFSYKKRNETVLLVDDVGVFWMFGVGADVRVLPNSSTKNLFLIFEKLN